MGCSFSTMNAVTRSSKMQSEMVDDEMGGLSTQPHIGPHETSQRIGTKPRWQQRLSQNIVTQNFEKNIRDYYSIADDKVLGSGISGSVRVCVHMATNHEYALKTLNKRKMRPDELRKLKEEIQFMADLDHPNILRLHEYFETNEVVHLVLELCKGGELLDNLHKQPNHQYPEKVACRYVHTMLSAVSYCHAHNIVHRDLKLENFLLESNEPEAELKLIDFGLSHYFRDKEILHSAVGTAYYVAPEVLLGNYNYKCDVWSIGVIAFMLLSGTPPFFGKTDHETVQAVKLGRWSFDEKLFKNISSDAKNFITKLLDRRVGARPSAAEALKHVWFTNQLKNGGKTTSQSSKLDTAMAANLVDRLDGFVRRPSLSKVCMEVVAHTLQPEQVEDLRKQFRKVDTSQTGEISFVDFKRILDEHKAYQSSHSSRNGSDSTNVRQPLDAYTFFSGVDVDQVGKISYHEFLAATVSRKVITEDNLRVAFEKMSSHTSYISSEDIQDLLGREISIDKVELMLEEINLPSDCQIGYNEFKHILNGGTSSPPVLRSASPSVPGSVSGSPVIKRSRKGSIPSIPSSFGGGGAAAGIAEGGRFSPSTEIAAEGAAAAVSAPVGGGLTTAGVTLATDSRDGADVVGFGTSGSLEDVDAAVSFAAASALNNANIREKRLTGINTTGTPGGRVTRPPVSSFSLSTSGRETNNNSSYHQDTATATAAVNEDLSIQTAPSPREDGTSTSMKLSGKGLVSGADDTINNNNNSSSKGEQRQ